MSTKASLVIFLIVGLMAVAFIVLFKFLAAKSGIAPLQTVAGVV